MPSKSRHDLGGKITLEAVMRAVWIRTLCAAGTAGWLGACGGGSSAPAAPAQPAPTISEFTTDRTGYFVGEEATLVARFSDGSGRIDPEVGAVQSGVPVRIARLADSREFTLTVESSVGRVTRSVRVSVSYRDRYRAVAAGFRAMNHSATVDRDGNAVLIGGARGQGTLSAQIDRYDYRTGAFTRIGDLRFGRERHRAVLLADGRIFVTGGFIGVGNGDSELVDPRTGTVTSAGAPVIRRLDHTATRLRDGRVLIVGGVSAGEGAIGGFSRSAELWDPATGQYRLLASRMSVGRASHTATLLPNGKVLIVGGFSLEPGYTLAEVFDPAQETFSILRTTDNGVRGLHVTAALPDGSVLVAGGESEALEATATVRRFVGDTDGEQVLGNLLRSRTFADAGVTRTGRVLIFGGEVGDDNQVSATAESYTVANGAGAIADLPQPRFGATVSMLPDGRALIAGGQNREGWVDSVLVYE
jgi:hypothetical protein